MDWLILALFCGGLLLCVAFDISILYALCLGLALFLLHGRLRGFAWRELAKMALSGVLKVRNILITFLLIGILTALWRAAGTIPVIVCGSSAMIRPAVFLLMTFLLNCGVSALTGSSFGTAATMGAICAAMSMTMHIDIRLVGGAVLSGVYFGDRCSPVSTSALLVAELTGTDIFGNIRNMLRTALVPFLLSCLFYALLGALAAPSGEAMDLRAVFAREFELRWFALAPAAVILLLSALRVNVKLAMTASILSAVPLCLFLQGAAPGELLKTALFGFSAADAETAAIINGGGVISMLRTAAIVCLSSSYAGIFQRTGLLDGMKRGVRTLSDKTTPYAAALAASVLAGMVACNQTLTVMLTEQLCAGDRGGGELALDLEDTAIIVAPLIPWSIACGVPLAAVGAPVGAIPFACYLYLIPLWRLVRSRRARPEKRTAADTRKAPISGGR